MKRECIYPLLGHIFLPDRILFFYSCVYFCRVSKNACMKRILLLFAAVMMLYSPTDAARKKVGVVLSGGGAKGVAHIGVLKVLEEAGIPIDYIVGTSMGAIVGGLYAIGYSVDELDSMVRTQNWTALLSDKVARSDRLFPEREMADRYVVSVPLSKDHKIKVPAGFLAGQNVYNLLSELTVGYHDSISFDKLPIPFACVTYDMVKGREVVVREGNLPLAIRASMSIPGAFAPVEVNGMVLVDGGVINNFPVDVVRQMGAEVVIGVDLASGMKKAGELKSVMDIIDQFTSIIGETAYEKNKKNTDLYIHPDIHPYTAASFNTAAIDTLIRRGKERAQDQWEQIVALRDKIGLKEKDWYEHETVDYAQRSDSIHIGTIRIEGVSPQDEKIIRRTLSLQENSLVSTRHIQENINTIQGSGAFSNITYQLSGKPPYDFTLFLSEKSRNSLNLGFRFDTEEMAAILLNTTLGPRTLKGTTFELTGRLSKNPYIKVDYSIGSTFMGQLGLSYMFKYNNLDIYERGNKRNNVTFGQHQVDLGITGIRLRNMKFTAGLRFDYFDYHNFLFSTAGTQMTVKPEGLVSYYVSGLLETLNNYYYPSKGLSLRMRWGLFTDNFATYNEGTPFSSVDLGFRWALSPSKRVTFIPAVYGRVLIGPQVAYSMWNCIGGDVAGRYLSQQLPFVGVQHFEMIDNSIVVMRLDFRVRLWKRHYVSLLGNYGKQSHNFGDIVSGEDLIGGGFAYSFDSPIGPIGFMVDYSNLDKKAGFYFNMGRYF